MPVLSSAGFSSTAAAAAARRSSGANRSTPPSFDSAAGAGAAANPLRRPSALILRFPPNFVRQLSTKARRNCSNIGVAQIVAASWSDSPDSPATPNLPAAAAAEEVATAAGVSGTPVPSPVAVLAAAEDAVAVLTTVEEFATAAGVNGSPLPPPVTVPADAAADGVNGVAVPEAAEDGSTDGVNGVTLPEAEEDGSTDGVNGVAVPAAEEDVEPPITVDSLLSSDGSLAVHAGERSGRGIVTDAITTPIVNTSAYWFKNSQELIDFKEKRHTSFEYGRYGNPTTEVLEKKMSALERAESTLFVSSGMYASVAMMTALVPPGGHIITTTDCYRKTRIFVQNELSKSGISAIVIDPADMDSLRRALDENNVSLFFTESPTNPFLRCVDIELVSQLCHSKGALVCIDGTFASPVNQKALTFGADIVLHSATKFIAGHNDVLGGCLSGSEELISRVRQYHHVIGGVINPNASSMIIRGMKTLHLRVQHQNSTALRMAQFLEEHPKITRVYYPGLTSHPEHHIAKRQMTGFGGVVSFEIAGDLKATSKFIDSLKIPYLAPSFGGCESIVDQPAIMSYWDLEAPERAKYGIMDNLVRFSFGIEGFEDLKADIVQALAKI